MAQQNTSKNFTFKYVKSSTFKTIKVDGVIGGLNVKREISMNFYVDAIDLHPNVIHAIGDNKTIGEAIPVEKNAQSAIRELQTGINIDIPTAKSIVVWLNSKIKEAEKQNTDLKEAGVKQLENL